VLGRFADMLIAVETHPAMLYYLDNTRSMGVDSIAGINADKGINENLAREILELHTLGVRGGYSQTDVTSFANVLTGWTYVDPADPAHGGEFLFNKRLHEPGEQTVLGKFYAEAGVDQGRRAVLADLAHHTATAQHVAQKLARHFVADEPPPPLVAKLAKAFMDSDGNLKAVAKALVTADEAWTPARTKLKRPSEWIVSMLRLTSAPWNTKSPWDIGRVLAVQADARRIAVAATGAERLARYRSGLDRWCPAPARHCQRVCRTPALLRSGGAARERARSDRLAQYS